MSNALSENRLIESNVLSISPASAGTPLARPFISSRVSAGFPSPAENEMGVRLDFNKYFIKHPAATFYVKVCGDSMIEKRIDDGDILLVDRAERLQNGKIVIARVNSDFCGECCAIRKTASGWSLPTGNTNPLRLRQRWTLKSGRRLF